MASIVKVDKIAQASGTPEFTIPTADGTAKSALITDGSGVLSFATGTPSSSNFLRGDGTWQTVTTTALTGSTNTWIPTITGANALTGTANFTYDGNILDVKNSGTASSIKLYCESSNAHYQAIKAAPHSGSSDWTLTLPGTVPSVSGQALTATTAGVASWATVGGSDNTPAFHVKRTSNFNIGDDTTTLVEFNVESWDTDSAYNTSTFRFTVPSGEAGKYFMYATANISGSSLSETNLRMRVNGTNRNSYQFQSNLSLVTYNNTIVAVMDLAAADYVDVTAQAQVGSGVGSIYSGGIGEYCYFGGYKLGF